ncbi:MAG: RNA-binding protein [Lawsonibacter sp.]|nr:RNA-binding protein [Lawsonibacter sp.]
MTKKELLDRCARTGEERVLLARVLDKLEQAQGRGIPAHTPFLSPGEQAAVADLLAAWGNAKCIFWGGYSDAERSVCLFLPDWQEAEDALQDPEGPLAAAEAVFPLGAEPGHRDILGALMGLGLTREKLGDILLPEPDRCQVVLLRETLPILLSQWESAGRWHVSPRAIPLNELAPRPLQGRVLRDTVASPRLDAVLAAGFSLPRSKAAAYIAAGRVAVNHRECLKGDKLVEEGDVLTCRGLGKCILREMPGQSKKGRTMLVLERFS